MAVCILQVFGQLGQEGMVVDIGEVQVGVPMVGAAAVRRPLREHGAKALRISQLPESAPVEHALRKAIVTVQDKDQRCPRFHAFRCIVDVFAVDAQSIVDVPKRLHVNTRAVIHRGPLEIIEGFRIGAARNEKGALCPSNGKAEEAKEVVRQGEFGVKVSQDHI